MASVLNTSENRLGEIIAEFGKDWGIEGATLRSRNPVGDSVIHLIAARNEADLLDLAILGGEVVDTRGEFGWTPLHSAICCEAWASVEKLIALGADTALCDDHDETARDMLRDKRDVPEHILKLLGVA